MRTVSSFEVAKPFREEISRFISTKAIKVKLVGYLANKDPFAEEYARVTEKTCVKIGIEFEIRKVKREELEDTIIAANEDEEIHGIMVYYPVFGGGHDQYIQNCVSPYKDVEGLCHLYRFNMYHNIRYLDSQESQKCVIPCTPLAIIKILTYCKVYNELVPFGNQLHGKIITIINRSEVVGRPLAALLSNDGAIVYSVDVNDILEFHRGNGLCLGKHEVNDSDLTLSQVLSISDVVITGVPSSNYKVDSKSLKEGVVAVNFASNNNFNDDIVNKASIFVPNIGSVTVSMLQRNLLRLREYQLEKFVIKS